MCVDMRGDMCVDMCAGMCAYMCADMRADGSNERRRAYTFEVPRDSSDNEGRELGEEHACKLALACV